MDAYRVQHRYAAYRDGRQIGPWAEGDRIELEAADAEWVNRDSPGTLLAEGGATEPERQQAAGRDRQARPGRNRGRS